MNGEVVAGEEMFGEVVVPFDAELEYEESQAQDSCEGTSPDQSAALAGLDGEAARRVRHTAGQKQHRVEGAQRERRLLRSRIETGLVREATEDPAEEQDTEQKHL